VFTDEEWQSFCQVIGNPPWTQDAKFKTIIGRKRNEDELNRLIEEWTINFSAEEVMNLMQTAGVAAGVVENAKDVLDDPQLKHRDAIWRLAHSEIGAALHIGATFLLSETPAEARMAAPCLGEHTEYVCREFLGMSDDEFVRLFADGVFE
jgi:crotonobetainyl-CoA:carnitine CoA-transferase CaiB-like acyl-CoA transferase